VLDSLPHILLFYGFFVFAALLGLKDAWLYIQPRAWTKVRGTIISAEFDDDDCLIVGVSYRVKQTRHDVDSEVDCQIGFTIRESGWTKMFTKDEIRLRNARDLGSFDVYYDASEPRNCHRHLPDNGNRLLAGGLGILVAIVVIGVCLRFAVRDLAMLHAATPVR
jgi:hypothetical protein